jgi:hypothetical protein
MSLRNRITAPLPALLVVLAFVVFAARMFRLISRYAVNIFYSDQWVFNDATLFQKHSLWQMFAWQHGPHRQGLGALFEKLVDPPFDWNSRIESFVVGGVILAAAICALWLKRRLYGPFTPFDIVIPAIFFAPGQWETLFLTANFAHGPLPLLLIMLYCLAWTCRRSVIRYPLVLLIGFVTTYTGFGLFLGVLTPILLLLDYRASVPEARLPRAYLIAVIVVALASLASFFIGYRFNPDLDCFSFRPQSPISYLAYAALMFANCFALKGTGALQQVVGIAALIALLAFLTAAVYRLLRGLKPGLPKQNHERPLIVAALIAYCLLFCANTAYGRLCSGLGLAQSSRYVIYLNLGMLGAYFALLNVPRPYARNILLTGLLLAVLPAARHVNPGEMIYFRDVKLKWKACYLQSENIDDCNRRAGSPIFSHAPERTHLQEKLQYLKRTRQNLYLDSDGP